MSIIKRILGQPLSEDELVNCFDNASRSILSEIEQKNPFYTKLFPSEDLPRVALDSVRSSLHEVSKTKSRKFQSRRLLGQYFLFRQEEISMQYFSHECPDIMIAAYSSSLIDGGDDFLLKLSLKIDRGELGLEHFLDMVKAYFKRKYYLEIYKNNVFLTVIQTFYGKIDKQEDLQRYEIIVKEHLKKLGVELLLKDSKEDAVFSKFSENYDFSETRKRSDLIALFIQGVELNSNATIERACSDFIELLQKNYESFSAIKDDLGVS